MWPFSKKISEPLPVKKNHGYGDLWPFAPSHTNFNVFKSFLNGGSPRVDHRLAYRLHDTAAPLASATDRITDAVAQLTPVVVDADGVAVEDSAVLDTLKNPGFGQTQQQVIEDFTLSFLLTNNAYFITDHFHKTLRTSKPFNVDVRANTSDGYAEKYRVTSQAGSAQSTFMRQSDWMFIDSMGNELTHTRTKSNNNGLEGRSPIEPIFTDIGQRISGGMHNLGLLQNGSRLTGMLSTEEPMSEEQFARLKEQLDQQHSGPANAGNNMIVEGGMTFTDMAKTNREMDYAKILSSSSQTIFIAYKIPLPLIEQSSQTFSNFNQASQSFYDDAVFPTAELVYGAIATTLQIEDGFTLTFNKDEIPAIRDRRLNEAKTRHEIGVFSDNETRVTLAMEPYLGGDVIYKPGNLLPVGSDDGALDDGEIEGEKAAFIALCLNDDMTVKQAQALWSKSNRKF